MHSLMPSYINTNFRQNIFGTDSLNYFSNSTYTFNFQHGNFTDILFINSYFNYSYFNTFISDEITQRQNILIDRKIYEKGKAPSLFISI